MSLPSMTANADLPPVGRFTKKEMLTSAHMAAGGQALSVASVVFLFLFSVTSCSCSSYVSTAEELFHAMAAAFDMPAGSSAQYIVVTGDISLASAPVDVEPKAEVAAGVVVTITGGGSASHQPILELSTSRPVFKVLKGTFTLQGIRQGGSMTPCPELGTTQSMHIPALGRRGSTN